MCGICGITGPAPDRRARVEGMVGLLAHRGPDDSRLWEGRDLTLGHTRLRILDLSPAGAQPMRRGSLVLTFNGEIYNWRRLRAELEGRGAAFQSQCDTEVLLAMYEEFGIDMLPRLEGMFAFALWDGERGILHLVRDRYGVKPLLYSTKGEELVFASELRCFDQVPWVRSLNKRALGAYLVTNYIPAPLTIWEEVQRLPPGCRLEVRPGILPAAPIRWFDPVRTVEKAAGIQPETTARELRATMADAVDLRLQADVPVGVFLSGGIDSSIVAALAAERQDKVTTLTVGYADAPQYDERVHAQLVADRLSTEHREILITTEEAQRAVVDVLDRLDEPFADDSLIPSYVLSRAARSEVTVILSGDGGDELFGGYTKYIGSRWATLPGGRMGPQLLAAATRYLPEGRATLLPNLVRMLRRFVGGASGDLLQRQRSWVGMIDYELARRLAGVELPSDDPVTEELALVLEATSGWSDDLRRVLMADVCYVLPHDMLEKVDRASMWNSLEVRSPFLDSRILPLAFCFPGRDHVGLWETKRVLRRLFRDVLPGETLRRRKRGFGIPLGEWVRGPLRYLLEERLDPLDVREVGLLDPEAVARLTQEHLERKRDRSWELWNAIVLQSWGARHSWTA